MRRRTDRLIGQKAAFVRGNGMPTEIKICGLSDEESVDAALEAGADFLGFVFFAKSPRNLTLDRAVPLMRRASG